MVGELVVVEWLVNWWLFDGCWVVVSWLLGWLDGFWMAVGWLVVS